jgi:hypothetical protein
MGAANPWTAPSPAFASARPLNRLANAMSSRMTLSRQLEGRPRDWHSGDPLDAEGIHKGSCGN